MGREIRRVPPNWEHPKFKPAEVRYAWQRNAYKPLKQGYAQDAAEFIKMTQNKGLQSAVEYFGNAPNNYDYVPDWTADVATWYQVYETVSEGTPTTPPFPTKEELIDYLVEHGEINGNGGYSREGAEAFVRDEYAPSMVIADGKVYEGIEAASLSRKEE